MPKITHGGVSNRLVDEDFIAPPGTPVEQAIDEGQSSQGEPDKDSFDPARKNEPDNQTPAFTPKKSTPAKKK